MMSEIGVPAFHCNLGHPFHTFNTMMLGFRTSGELFLSCSFSLHPLVNQLRSIYVQAMFHLEPAAVFI
jgi:hypothetical protein